MLKTVKMSGTSDENLSLNIKVKRGNLFELALDQILRKGKGEGLWKGNSYGFS